MIFIFRINLLLTDGFAMQIIFFFSHFHRMFAWYLGSGTFNMNTFINTCVFTQSFASFIECELRIFFFGFLLRKDSIFEEK